MANSKLSASDFVNDPIHGVVPKDAVTAVRLREEADKNGEPDPTVSLPPELVQSVLKGSDAPSNPVEAVEAAQGEGKKK